MNKAEYLRMRRVLGAAGPAAARSVRSRSGGRKSAMIRDQSLCFAVVSGEASELAAFAHCWTTAFIKDFAVAPGFRRRGLGRALMAEIFRTFHHRGAGTVDLKVQAGNLSAIAFYEAMGMFVVGE